MKIVFYTILFYIFSFNYVYAQEILTETYREDMRSAMLEYIEIRNQELITELDSIKETTNSTLPITQEDIESLKRLKNISKTIPLDYNDHVKFYIEKYSSSNYRPYMNNLLGLSQHYFPIYDKILRESGLPEEVKYLSLVESSLNPHLISTSGAVGLWQFMYVAAKEYDLEMSNHYDERKDPYSSSYAFAAYIQDAYRLFDDWLLALASYNCGRGCVQRAIIRSGIERPSFWDLSPFLPQETRNYIPKYIAMTYVLSEAEYFGIEPTSTEFALDHKEIFIDKSINMESVAQALGLSKEELKKYNPAFKRDLVNGSIDKPKRLLIPVTNFTNDSLLYVALNTVNTSENVSTSNDEVFRVNASGAKYKVKGGETLTMLSKRFGVTVQDLRAWNGLSARSSIVGRTLVVEKPLSTKLTQNTNRIASSKNSPKVIVYTVKSGDSLDRIANKYNGVSVMTLKADNNLKSNLIKPGMKLKIKQSKG